MCHKKRTENWLYIQQSSTKCNVFQISIWTFPRFLRQLHNLKKNHLFWFLLQGKTVCSSKEHCKYFVFYMKSEWDITVSWDWNLKIYYHSIISAGENWIHNMKLAIKKNIYIYFQLTIILHSLLKKNNNKIIDLKKKSRMYS